MKRQREHMTQKEQDKKKKVDKPSYQTINYKQPTNEKKQFYLSIQSYHKTEFIIPQQIGSS
jgi:hypothetical protein